MITTTTTLPAPVQQTMDDILLSVRTPNLIMKLGAMTKRLPAKGGRVLRMARYDRLPTAPVPLGKKRCAQLKSSLIDLETEVVYN